MAITDSILVDGAELGFGAYRVYLANKKVVQISGPSAVDVRDGALMLLGSDGKAQMAFAAGTWLSVNADPTATVAKTGVKPRRTRSVRSRGI